MSMMASVTIGIFWVSLAVVVYAYVGYPALVWWLARRATVRVAVPGESALPSVSILVAAHNEEKHIGQRIANALASTYPPDRFEVVVASDGSTDATTSIVRQCRDRRVRLLEAVQRRGKASILNAAFHQLRGDVVVLSDANTVMHADAVRELVRWFAHPDVGVVCGKLVLRDPSTGNNVDSLYWRYETFIKRCEGRLGALLGANGGIYAIRKELFEGIRRDTIVDDLVVPLMARIRSGCEIVYDDRAVAEEETAPDLRSEFGRRSRLGAGGFQSIITLRRLLNPKRGWVAFTFLSHKILRWLCPFALLSMLLSSLAAPGYRVVCALQVAAYLAAMAGYVLRGRGPAQRVIRLGTMFAMMNLALLVGFWRWCRGEDCAVWQRTAR